jgi:hypothetical protein
MDGPDLPGHKLQLADTQDLVLGDWPEAQSMMGS